MLRRATDKDPKFKIRRRKIKNKEGSETAELLSTDAG